jgi:hypothetical protein
VHRPVVVDLDPQIALVDQAMVAGAQGQEVRGIVRTVERERPEVVQVQPEPAGAPGTVQRRRSRSNTIDRTREGIVRAVAPRSSTTLASHATCDVIVSDVSASYPSTCPSLAT